jgi:hypothetical protein
MYSNRNAGVCIITPLRGTFLSPYGLDIVISPIKWHDFADQNNDPCLQLRNPDVSLCYVSMASFSVRICRVTLTTVYIVTTINHYQHTTMESLPETNSAPGDTLTMKSKALEMGASAIQDFAPIKHICAHLNAFHAYADDPKRCVEANHYCSHLNEGMKHSKMFLLP